MNYLEPLNKALRIESERLYLRPITEEDTDTVLRLRNADYVKRNFFYRNMISRDEHLSFFRNKCLTGEVLYFLVYEKSTETPIGCVYYQHYDSLEKSLESGLFFAENAPKGKGYATEGYKLANEFIFANYEINKLFARVIAENSASIKLHLRAGYVETERGLEQVIPDGNMIQAVSFELVRLEGHTQ